MGTVINIEENTAVAVRLCELLWKQEVVVSMPDGR